MRPPARGCPVLLAAVALLAVVAAAPEPVRFNILGGRQVRELHRRRALREGPRRNQNHTASARLPQRKLQARPSEEIEEGTLRGNTEPLGYFYAEVAIGTPSQRFTLMVDTRSSLTTVPCAGCTRCGSHTNAFFEPAESSTYIHGCTDVPGCGAEGTHSLCTGRQCAYSVTHQDGSSIRGELARDEIGLVYANLFGTPLTRFKVLSTFGCQSSETGQLHAQAADGVLGLGLSEHSDHLTVVDSYVAQHGLRDTLTFCFSRTGGTMAFGADPPAVHRGCGSSQRALPLSRSLARSLSLSLSLSVCVCPPAPLSLCLSVSCTLAGAGTSLHPSSPTPGTTLSRSVTYRSAARLSASARASTLLAQASSSMPKPLLITGRGRCISG